MRTVGSVDSLHKIERGAATQSASCLDRTVIDRRNEAAIDFNSMVVAAQKKGVRFHDGSVRCFDCCLVLFKFLYANFFVKTRGEVNLRYCAQDLATV